MPFIHARDAIRQFGPCRVVDANGDQLLGSIVEADLESGVYVVICRDDRGRLAADGRLTVRYERCEAPAPLTLVPIDTPEVKQ